MGCSFLFIKLIFVVCNLIDSTISDAPNFISGCGLTFLSATQLNIQLYEVVVSSKEVRGNQSIQIVLPPDYTTSGDSRRYPVLYLLHGAHGNDSDWTRNGAVQNIIGNESLITVMPNGDPFGFYTNWILPGNATPQNWRTYHMEQLMPWIDLNIRTVAKKEGRATAGDSMGGFGSIHYAELYSDNFTYAASFSGALHIFDTRLQNIILSLPGPEHPLIGPFGYPNASMSSNGWFTEDALTRASELRNITIALYVGDVGTLEPVLLDGSSRLRDLLVTRNISVYFDNYGDGQSIGYGCDGTHSWACFRAALIDVLPRMMAVLQQQH